MTDDTVEMLEPLGDFKPGVFYNEELRLTQMMLKDTFIVWCPWGPYKGHAVDIGFDENGEIVGITIWDDVRTRDALEASRVA